MAKIIGLNKNMKLLLIPILPQLGKNSSGIAKTIRLKLDNYENPPKYHNFTKHSSSSDFYNNRFYDNFEPVLIDKKEYKLTIRDKIRIQWALQILRNFLQQIYPNYVVIQQICWLNYLCYTQNSIQPLRDFYKKYNLMNLWPLY